MRTLDRRAVAYALALCLPYVQAGPVPQHGAPHPLHAVAESSRMASAPACAHSWLAPVAAFLRHLDIPRHTRHVFLRHLRRALSSFNSSAIPSAAVSTVHPIIGIARIDPLTLSYTVPPDFVVLRQHFNAGFIVLSYCIALVGSLCTLELLVRRTTNAGWRNQVLLVAAGMTFGSVSTFAMHFIFNNSLSLTHPHSALGHTKLYLSYDAGYTVLSLVASCLAMTIAFFIMGTRPGDWDWLLPKARRRRAHRRPAQRVKGEEEYGKWKDAQKKALSLGGIRLGELVVRAGSVAKWSLMEGMNTTSGTTTVEGENGKWKTAMRKMSGKDADGAAGMGGKMERLDGQEPWTGENAVIRQDKKLQELEFRLGRSAVQLELEHRGMGANDQRTTHHQLSNASMADRPHLQIDVAHANSVRIEGSISSAGTVSSRLTDAGPGAGAQGQTVQATFAQYSFPASATSTTALRPAGAYAQRSTSFDVERTAPDAPDEPRGISPDRVERRRSSLPSAYTLTRRPSFDSHALSRITSEGDMEPRPANDRTETADTDVPFDLKKDDAYSPSLRQSGGSDGSASLGKKGKKHRIRFLSAHDGKWDAIDRFLGFDVVTWGDIVKIMMTGTLAGWGVAGMRQYSEVRG